MKTKIFNLIIIDESGSMVLIKQHAINSVNETLQSIRKATEKHEEQEHYVSLITFNSDMKTVYDCVSINDVNELNDSTYAPNANTALYDAMGHSINALMPKIGETDKVLVTIVTDGCENASSEYTRESINSLVEELKKKGWVFAYIGANHDATSAANAISITNVLQFQATGLGTQRMSHKLAKSREVWYDKLAYCKSSSIDNFFAENND